MIFISTSSSAKGFNLYYKGQAVNIDFQCVVHRVHFDGGVLSSRGTHTLLVELVVLVKAQDLETNSFIRRHFGEYV